MNLDDLRALVAVVETGSLIAAARNLGLPRSTLRRRIDEIEARAGIALLIRTPSGVVPTEAGAMLVRGARPLLHDASALLSRVRAAAEDAATHLRVTLPVGLPKEAIAAVFSALRHRNPNLTLQARFAADPIGDLLDHADMIVHFGFELPPGPWLTWTLLPLRERLLASREYLATHGTPERVEDLEQHALFVWERPRMEARELPLADGTTARCAPAVQANEITMLRQLAVDGMGIAFVPDAAGMISGDTTADLVSVLPDIVGRECVLRLSVPAVLAELPKVQAVVNLLALSARALVSTARESGEPR